MVFVISADDLKKTIQGYDPNRSDKFHHASAKLADKEYDIILLSGGAASGKTEYSSVYLSYRDIIVLDGTLPSFEGAKIKIRKAEKRNKHISITAVMPEDLNIAFQAFLGRERKFPPEHFFRTHSAARKALLEIAENIPDIEITLIESRYDPDGTMHFTEIIFSDRESMLELLRRRQYTEEDIRNEIFHAA